MKSLPKKINDVYEEILPVVNEKGSVVGELQRGQVYLQGLLHPAVNVFLFNNSFDILLQKRASGRPTFANYWDISVSEHLKVGENFKDAAKRGLSEELNLINLKPFLLREKHKQYSIFEKEGKSLIENELVELYGVVLNKSINLDTNNEEVSRIQFFSFENLHKIQKITPWANDEINYLKINKTRIFDIFKKQII